MMVVVIVMMMVVVVMIEMVVMVVLMVVAVRKIPPPGCPYSRCGCPNMASSNTANAPPAKANDCMKSVRIT